MVQYIYQFTIIPLLDLGEKKATMRHIGRGNVEMI